jgi:ribosomal protein S18 acetylase RimI-like enzyme
MKIRNATIKDLESVQELNFKLFKHDSKYDDTLDVKWPYSKNGLFYFKKSLTNKNKITLVCENNRNIMIAYLIGGIMKTYSYRKNIKIAELENTFVESKYRKEGIGTKLFDEFKKWAKSQKVSQLKVYAYSKNTNALLFYSKNKFKEEELILTQNI